MTFFDYNFRRYNVRVLLYMLLLSGIGILAIWSATNQDRSMTGKQIMGIAVGLVLAVALSLIDYHRLLSLSTLIYGGCIVLLAAVLIMGKSRGIATRWLVLPVIGQIQPAEFVKIGLVLFFSWYFQKYQERINQLPVLGMGALLFAVPAVLIFEQPNLSTTLVLTVIIAAVFGVLAVVVPGGVLLIYLIQQGLLPFLQGYQATRILAWIDPEQYASAYWQQENSIMAIGSGQLWGKTILWFLLTFITIGIYTAWMINNIKKWSYKHTKFNAPGMFPAPATEMQPLGR